MAGGKMDNERNIFEIRTGDINVEEIMKEIRQKIRDKGIEPVDFPDMGTLVLESLGADLTSFDTNTFEESIRAVNSLWEINSELPITSHRKGIGSLIVFGKKAVRKLLRWHIAPIVDQTRQFAASTVRTFNDIRKYMYYNIARVDALEKKVGILEDMMVKLNPASKYNEDIQRRIYMLEENVRGLNHATNQNKDVGVFAGQRLSRLEETIKLLQSLQASQSYASPQSSYIERTAVPAPAANSPVGSGLADTVPVVRNSQDTGIDYMTFELMYRGSREAIKESQKRYLKYLEGKNQILDIGCGRGEFIELMLETGKTGVKGIDLNENMVALCRQAGLPAEHGNAVDYLNRLEVNTLEGIYLGQVVEHMQPVEIVHMVRLAYEKLKEGGVLIMETPNPTCLAIFSNSFYLDMSHNKPVHPLTLEFILSSQGFREIETAYFSELEEKLPKLSGSGLENESEVNVGIDRLNHLLFGAQDYAIIGRK
jgi:O-antigen chain-terminating methyltransferase